MINRNGGMYFVFEGEHDGFAHLMMVRLNGMGKAVPLDDKDVTVVGPMRTVLANAASAVLMFDALESIKQVGG